MKGKRPRSQEIDVNSFREELGSSERAGRPVTGKPANNTSVIQARSSEDRKDVNVDQARERTERPGITHDVITVLDSPQTCSVHEAKRSTLGIWNTSCENGEPVADQDVSHESIMLNESDMEFRIPGLPHSVVKHAQSTSFRESIQKIENHPDRHALNKIYDKIKPKTRLVQNQTKWFKKWATSNCVNCSRRNPKRSAKHASHIRMLASSIARAGISCTKKQRSIGNSLNIRWTFFQSLSMSSWREDVMDIDMGKAGRKIILSGSSITEEMQKETVSRNPWSILTRSRIPYSNDWKSSKWRSLSCRRRSHVSFVRTRILLLQEQMVDLSISRFLTHHH